MKISIDTVAGRRSLRAQAIEEQIAGAVRLVGQSGRAGLSFPLWSTTVSLVVTDPTQLGRAAGVLGVELIAVDAAANRFRPGSELSQILARPGQEIVLTPVLNDLIAAALRVAAATDNLVDPTVAAAVIALGYDRDIAVVQQRAGLDRALLDRATMEKATASTCPAPGSWQIRHDWRTRRLLVPAGVGLDLGATAKAAAADRAAARIAAEIGAGVLVNLGGDIAVAGPPPSGGWRVAIGADHRTAAADPDQTVVIQAGGLATSSVTARAWVTPGTRETVHHIVDPRTGANPQLCWRSVSAVAGSCLDANAATTAAIVCGQNAPAWLQARGIPARLVDLTGDVELVCGWPGQGAGPEQNVGPAQDVGPALTVGPAPTVGPALNGRAA